MGLVAPIRTWPGTRRAELRALPGSAWTPVVFVALAGLVYLAAAPATADMAAHTYRTDLWGREGFTVWDGQWYGGHHEPGYSLLFAPLGVLAGPRLVGVLAALVAVAAFAWIARRHAPPGRALAATWLFVGGALSNVVIGRMPFMLGVCLAVCAWAAAEVDGRGRPGAYGLAGPPSPATTAGGRRRPAALGLAALLSLAAVWASPVAGLFLALAALGRALGGGRRDLPACAALAAPAVAGGLAVGVVFPEGGPDHFTASAFWPTLLLAGAGLALVAPAHRRLRAAALLYLLVLVGAFVLPASLGQNALRPGVVLGPALLALAGRRDRRLLVVLVAGALLYLQWLPAVRAVSEASGDPSSKPAFHSEVLRVIGERLQPGERLEVPLTRNHWEAAFLAPSVPLARGWHRQLDRESNPIFYDKQPLTAAGYRVWLREAGVRWIALPAVALDFSARAEAVLLRTGLPYLRLAYVSSRWRVWEVSGTRPPVSGPARLVATQPSGFTLRVRHAGFVRVRERHTPYWQVVAGAACVRRSPDGWTDLDVRHAGLVRVKARFSLKAAARLEGRCGP